MTSREAILLALRDALQADAFFPESVDVDVPEPDNWRELVDGLEDAAAVQDGPVTVLRAACGEGDVFELQLEAAIAYAVAGVDAPSRRARRDLGVTKVRDLILSNPTLGLNGEVYADLDPATRDDEQLQRGTVPVATAVVPIRILYTAASAVD